MSEEEETKGKPAVMIVVAIVGALGMIIAAWIGYESGKYSIDTTIAATRTAEAQATNASQTQNASGELPPLPIESFPMKVFVYKQDEEPALGAYFASFDLLVDGQGNSDYYFHYTIPDQGRGWAGLAFKFNKPVDLSEYTFLRARMTFHCEEMAGRLAIKDIHYAESAIPIGLSIGYKDGTTIQREGNQVTLTTPLSNFPAPDFEIIQEVLFHFDQGDPKGYHELLVHSIEFLKP
ncbi:MAG: hypothetical protein JXA78_13505 [Anaerolineales bacterium]|nr:hypothetical protein [Anaerolineales bacterium]